jgi:hypothetical protein
MLRAQGLSHREIAAAMTTAKKKATEDAVKKLLYEARKRLRASKDLQEILGRSGRDSLDRLVGDDE